MGGNGNNLPLSLRHFYARGLSFSCNRCSACCRYETGFVFLSEKDVSLLKTSLKMEYNDFLDTYCRWVPGNDGINELSLKEKSNYDCIFWHANDGDNSEGCLVYEARPLQCRTFPFWQSVMSSEKSWKMTAEYCPGIDQGDFHSHDSIEKMLAMRQMEPVISCKI
ncbi:MAG: YkgJ family cysteine cluster protein [Treponema sp.]|jgi:Fe-S-cluster containining protein|nr:YkgJ family cysteine cluster protein [Treponema sp.]